MLPPHTNDYLFHAIVAQQLPGDVIIRELEQPHKTRVPRIAAASHGGHSQACSSADHFDGPGAECEHVGILAPARPLASKPGFSKSPSPELPQPVLLPP
ncbi:hypothetical protein PMIN04_006413 [Paraphaeosphaeria minitans]